MNRKTLLSLIGITAVARIFYFLIGTAADYFLTYAPTFAYAEDKLAQYGLDRWLYSWANFDGVHYLTIVEKGYLGTGLIQAFFPLYPMLVWLVNVVIGNSIISALLVSNISTAVLLPLLFILVKETFNKKIAWWSIISLLVFPTSFFLFATYSESLFLVFVVASLLFKSRKQWLLMSICIAAASATRIVGVFLVPALIADQVLGKSVWSKSLPALWQSVKQNIFPVLWISAGSIGLLAYMYYLWITFNDPVFFWHVQSEFGGGRQESIIFLPQIIWRYVKIFLTVPFDLRWPIYLQELLFGLVPLVAISYFWLKTRIIPHSWAIFSIFALILPTLTGTFSSMARYALVAFPLYVLLGIAYNQYPKLRWMLILSSVVALFNVLLFIQGYWVA